MPKTYVRSVKIPHLIATSRNFSEFEGEEELAVDFGDQNSAVEEMLSIVEADLTLLSLLSRLDNREKVIFLYQVLREAGYNLNHQDCAVTLAITRERYMVLVKDVKQKASKIITNNKFITNGSKPK